MIVQPDREATCLAAESARDDRRNLALEIDQRFEDAFRPAELVPGLGQLFLVGDPRLALAVVALGAGLEDTREGGRARHVGEAADRLIRRRAEAGLAEESLLPQP